MTKIFPPRLAAIDLGTNTFRLVTRGLQRVEYPRIGLGVDRTGRIAPASVHRGLAALASFARIVRTRRLKIIGVVGTSALRDASNGPAFCESVRQRFGWRVEIIPGEEEAELTFSGATASLDLPRDGLILVSDVGGGSTELIWGAPVTRSEGVGKPKCQSVRMTPFAFPFTFGHDGVAAPVFHMLGRVSLKLGSVRMTERFGTQGRVPATLLRHLRSGVSRILDSARLPWARIHTVIGVGGTATTLAAILHGVDPYDEKKVHGASVPFESLEKMRDVLAVMTPRERMNLPGVPRGRADIVVAGTAIQTEIVSRARAGRMIASDAGILTGLILRAALARRAQKV